MDRFFRGSAALRHYTSFVYPKTEAALHNAMRPQRASTVASQIAFLVREQRAAHAEWLVNHDRAVQESDQGSNGRPRTPLYLILDNLRSAANVGNILRAAEAARVEKVFCCGITPVPSPSEPKVLKTALGAAEYVPHERAARAAARARVAGGGCRGLCVRDDRGQPRPHRGGAAVAARALPRQRGHRRRHSRCSARAMAPFASHASASRTRSTSPRAPRLSCGRRSASGACTTSSQVASSRRAAVDWIDRERDAIR